MTKDDAAFMVALAKRNGCTPKWHDGIFGWAWHCWCPDSLHAGDQQCSVLTHESARRRRP